MSTTILRHNMGNFLPSRQHEETQFETFGRKYTDYLFATNGVRFQASKTIPPKGEPSQRHTKMTVDALVNWLIPLEENK